jgi:hypothetical protein
VSDKTYRFVSGRGLVVIVIMQQLHFSTTTASCCCATELSAAAAAAAVKFAQNTQYTQNDEISARQDSNSTDMHSGF